ncbi:MAG: 5'-nucleotidase C-terminal domain-containing protein, partial [Paludibacteraceae bacterium]|nr:5'-nucleotidase C-terminal domain-containing protein [Paludibacteraceae bacterium]
LLEATGADVALLNAGAIRRESLPAGALTVGDVLQVDPFDDEVVVLEVEASLLPELVGTCQRRDRGREPILLQATAGQPVLKMVTTSYVASLFGAYPLTPQDSGWRNQQLFLEYLSKNLSVCR